MPEEASMPEEMRVYRMVAIVLLAVVLCCNCVPRLGDANWDGKVNSVDALAVATCANGDTPWQFFRTLRCGDVDGDGSLTQADVEIILRYDAMFPVAEPLGTGFCPLRVAPCKPVGSH